MSLIDRFRPKWRHSDPEVRSEAVRRLDADVDKDVLTRVARDDEDMGVRRLALKKIRSADLLGELANGQSDEGLKRLALEKAESLRVAIAIADDEPAAREALSRISGAAALAEVARAASRPDLRFAALERIDDLAALGDVACNADSPAVRLKALERLKAPSTLRAVAMNDEDEKVGFAAVDRIEDLDALRAIAIKANRKAVRRHAAERLTSLGGELEPDKKRRAEQSDLVREVERLAASREYERSEARMDGFNERWKEIGSGADERLQKRFKEAAEAVAASARRNRLVPSSAPIDPAADLSARRSDLCARVEALRGARAESELSSLAASWAELGPIDAESPVARRFDAAHKLATQAGDRFRLERARHQEIEQLVVAAEKAVDDDVRDAHKRLQEIAKEIERRRSEMEIDGVALERFQLARRRLDEREKKDREQSEARRKENYQRAQALLDRTSKLTTTDNFSQAVAALKEVNESFRKIGPFPADVDRDELRGKLDEVAAKLHIRVQELRENEDWKRWSNTSVREELCGRVEALAAETDLAVVGKKLRELQKAWAEAGPVERDKFGELRERFQKVAGELRARCDDHFKKLDFERQQNLSRKLDLCVAAEKLAESTEWKTTADELKKLQEEWKAVGPVPKAQGDQVWERFRGACDGFFNKRKTELDRRTEEWARNHERKEKMCLRAEELQKSTEWDATASELKRLQAEWKKVGPVKRADSEVLWQRFRGACDVFFNRFTRRDDIARLDEQERIAGLITAVETFADAEQAPDPVEPMVAATRTAWNELRKLDLNDKVLVGRLDVAVGRVLERHPDAFAKTELDVTNSRVTRDKLCARIEEIGTHLERIVADRTPSVEKMADQIRQALVANAFRDKGETGSGSLRELSREVEQLGQRWSKLSPVPGSDGEALQKRFEVAGERFQERCKALQ